VFIGGSPRYPSAAGELPRSFRGEMDNAELTHKYNRLQYRIEQIEQRYESELRHLTTLINQIIAERKKEKDDDASERIASKEAMLRDLLSIQADLIKHHELLDTLISDSYQFYQLNQEKIDEICQLLPSMVKSKWYHWVILTLLILLVILNSGLAIFLLRNHKKVNYSMKVSLFYHSLKRY